MSAAYESMKHVMTICVCLKMKPLLLEWFSYLIPFFFLQYDRYGNSSSCNLPCTGDSNKICGGPWALSVYNTGKDFIPLLKIKETISMPVIRNVMNGMTCAPLGGISASIDQ